MNECVLEQDTLLILPFLASTWENLLIKLQMKMQQYDLVDLPVVVAAAGKNQEKIWSYHEN